MEAGEPVIFDDLGSLQMRASRLAPYDGEIGVRLLHHDPVSGAEHDLIRYPAGLKAKVHRHTAAHTIVVLEGRLAVNDEVVGPGSYCHFPAGQPMFHGPAGEAGCLFVIIFHGPFDVELVGDGGFRAGPP